jgi:hypothetical protein
MQMLENDRVAGGATREVVENKGARLQGGSGEEAGASKCPRKQGKDARCREGGTWERGGIGMFDSLGMVARKVKVV